MDARYFLRGTFKVRFASVSLPSTPPSVSNSLYIYLDYFIVTTNCHVPPGRRNVYAAKAPL